MAEIELKRRVKYAGDVHAELLKAGWDCCTAAEFLNNIPDADVVPVRHARWDENGRCSNCGGHAPFWCMASTYYKSPWCQESGAKMDLEG